MVVYTKNKAEYLLLVLTEAAANRTSLDHMLCANPPRKLRCVIVEPPMPLSPLAPAQLAHTRQGETTQGCQ